MCKLNKKWIELFATKQNNNDNISVVDLNSLQIFSLPVIAKFYLIVITLFRYQLGIWGVQNSWRSSTAGRYQGNTWPTDAARTSVPWPRGDWAEEAPWNGGGDTGEEPALPRTAAWNPARTPWWAHTCVKMWACAVKNITDTLRGCNDWRLCNAVREWVACTTLWRTPHLIGYFILTLKCTLIVEPGAGTCTLQFVECSGYELQRK